MPLSFFRSVVEVRIVAGFPTAAAAAFFVVIAVAITTVAGIAIEIFASGIESVVVFVEFALGFGFYIVFAVTIFGGRDFYQVRRVFGFQGENENRFPLRIR